jgi:hypothetical protein
MLAANIPTRWWPQATTDFVTKKNYLWYTADEEGALPSNAILNKCVFKRLEP